MDEQLCVPWISNAARDTGNWVSDKATKGWNWFKRQFGGGSSGSPDPNDLKKAVEANEGTGKKGIIEQHHLLPKQFKKQFEKAGLDIEKYKIALDKADHRLK